MFHLPLEIMARVTRKQLVIRSCFGEETVVRFFPDVMLEPGFQSMRLYANIYSRSEIEDFLAFEGFSVQWVEDKRQKGKFKGKPEVVGGIPFDYGFLVPDRIQEPPSEERIMGSDFLRAADLWRRERQAAE